MACFKSLSSAVDSSEISTHCNTFFSLHMLYVDRCSSPNVFSRPAKCLQSFLNFTYPQLEPALLLYLALLLKNYPPQYIHRCVQLPRPLHPQFPRIHTHLHIDASFCVLFAFVASVSRSYATVSGTKGWRISEEIITSRW